MKYLEVDLQNATLVIQILNRSQNQKDACCRTKHLHKQFFFQFSLARFQDDGKAQDFRNQSRGFISLHISY